MRLIDADVLTKNDEVTEWLSINPIRTGKMLKAFSELFIKKVNEMPTINAIPIPEDATNGDVIKAMFPNGKIIKTEDGDCGYEIYLDDTYSFCSWFDGLWWNAKYKGVE